MDMIKLNKKMTRRLDSILKIKGSKDLLEPTGNLEAHSHPELLYIFKIDSEIIPKLLNNVSPCDIRLFNEDNQQNNHIQYVYIPCF